MEIGEIVKEKRRKKKKSMTERIHEVKGRIQEVKGRISIQGVKGRILEAYGFGGA